MRALVEQGKVDIEQADSKSKTALMIACEKGNLDIVKFLLSKNASMLDMKKQKKNALIRATINGHIHVVSYLLKFGVHPDLPDSSGNTPVHYAAGYGWTHVLKFLIETGKASPDLKNDWNSTPAMIAMLKGHFSSLEYLLSRKDVSSSLVDSEGRSVVSQLCMNFNLESLSQIEYITSKTKVDFASVDGNGWNAMHHLVGCKLKKVIRDT